jgi:hypothetical protein
VSIAANSVVQAYEPMTVAAGTFNTLKVKEDTVTHYSSLAISTESETCWLDVISGASVKCNSTTQYDYSHLSSAYLSALAGVIGGSGTETFSLELTAIKHAADFAFSMTAAVNGVAIPSVYLTPIERMPLVVSQGKTLTLNATNTLSWRIVGSVTGDAPITLSNGPQVVVVDGYSVSVTLEGGKLTAKVLTAPAAGVGTFTLVGGTFADFSQNVAVTIYMTADPTYPVVPTLSNCSSAQNFC